MFAVEGPKQDYSPRWGIVLSTTLCSKCLFPRCRVSFGDSLCVGGLGGLKWLLRCSLSCCSDCPVKK